MTPSIWRASAHDSRFPALHEDIAVDVAIVGGGITGITAAMLLSKGGVRVAVLEADTVGMGTTGHSTGNLYAPVDWHLYAIEDKWGRDTMEAVAHSRQDAVDLIELAVRTYGLDCDFARRPFCLFAPQGASRSAVEHVEREYRAASNANLNARIVDQIPLPLAVDKALVIEGQAQFHPGNYVRDLARALHRQQDCRVFEHSQVIDIDDKSGVLRTDLATVKADKIVMATHTPKGVFAAHMEMSVYREYGIAAKLKAGDYPQGIFWSAADVRSIRSAHADGEQYLIVVGDKHKTGHEERTERHLHALERYAMAHFNAQTPRYRWSAQHYRSADALPYIGQSPGSTRTYIATGFATDGLTYGALAAVIISEDILGRESKWSDLYEPGRLTPVKSAKAFAAQQISMANHFIQGYFADAPSRVEAVARGEGKVLEVQGEKLAVFRDEDDQVTVLSPTCTHLGCTVAWNTAERSWDCPCHGSRYTVQGEIIEGPAVADLQRVTGFSLKPGAARSGARPPDAEPTPAPQKR